MYDDTPKKKCSYRCTNCGEEWTRWLAIDERKTRRWCPNKCGILVTPYQTERKDVRSHSVKTTKPKPYY